MANLSVFKHFVYYLKRLKKYKKNTICKGEETNRICLLSKELFLVADYF